MKRFKLASVYLRAIVLIAISFSFTHNNTKSVNNTTLKLYDVSSKTQITTSKVLSIDPKELNDQSYWSHGSITSHGNSNRLKAIQFDSDQCSFQQAIDLVKSYFTATGTLPIDGGKICDNSVRSSYCVTIFRG